MKIHRKCSLGLIVLLLVGILLGCGDKQADKRGAYVPVSTPIAQKQIQFLSEADRQTWRAPLIQLLSNAEYSILEWIKYDGSEGDGRIPSGFQCALFDVDLNGVPELLVNLGGGSAGNTFFNIYDLEGTYMGAIGGGGDDSWCIYRHVEADAYCAVGRYYLRSGAAGRMQYVDILCYDEERGCYENRSYLYAEYELVYDLISSNLGEDVPFEDRYEQYLHVHHEVNGEDAPMDRYLSEQEHFTVSYVRIPETAIRLVDWDDVAAEDDDPSVKAERMADALIATKQQFIAP